MTINEVFKQIIRTKEMDLRRMNENLESLTKSGHFAIVSDQPSHDEDSFSVLKDRHTIHATIESIVSEAEQKFGYYLASGEFYTCFVADA